MKKFWKNLCTYSLAVTCGVAVAGCGENNDGNISRDLDGDGAISSWETVFAAEGSSNRVIASNEIIAINSVNDLMAINDNNSSGKSYKLMRDIDCRGQEISIDLLNSTLYGNNKVIYNFKLGRAQFKTDPVEGEDRVVVSDAPQTMALFYNGREVYDLKVFMGNQQYVLDYSIEEDDTPRNTIYSPFVNIDRLESVEVKGSLNVSVKGDQHAADKETKLSLLYSSFKIKENSEQEEIAVGTTISDCSVDGKIYFDDKTQAMTSYIGGIASVLDAHSKIYNSYASVDIFDSSDYRTHVGGLVGKNNGFISTCVTTGEMKFSYWGGIQLENIGGVVGYSSEYSEIKNCSTNMSISSAIPEDLQSVPNQSPNHPINIGGVVGRSESSILNYVQSDAVININNPHKGIMFTVGGLCGENIKGDVQNVICRGSINAVNPYEINAANMCGKSVKGSVRSAIVTTDINIDTYSMPESNFKPVIKLGSLVIFEEFLNNDNLARGDYTAENAPYLKGVLNGGNETVLLGPVASFEYDLGLRNTFKTRVGVDESGETPIILYKEKFPLIMESVYVLNSNNIRSNYDANNDTYYNSNELKELPIKYSSEIHGRPDIKEASFKEYAKFVINDLGFKTYLNHNELVADANSTVDSLSFSVPVEKQDIKFHEEKQYNGELAYFDRKFDDCYDHDLDEFGNCKNGDDKIDKLFSFFNYLFTKNIGSENYSLRFGQDFLKINPENDSIQSRIESFKNSIENTLKCMGVDVSKSYVMTNYGKQINLDSDESISDNIQYLVMTLNSSDFMGTKTFVFDISDFQVDNATGEYPDEKASKIFEDKIYYDIRLIINPNL